MVNVNLEDGNKIVVSFDLYQGIYKPIINMPNMEQVDFREKYFFELSELNVLNFMQIKLKLSKDFKTEFSFSPNAIEAIRNVLSHSNIAASVICPEMNRNGLVKDFKAVIPHTVVWDELCRKTGVVSGVGDSRIIPVARIRDFMSLNDTLPDFSKVNVNNSVMSYVHDILPAPYDGSDESLRKMPVDSLNYVSSDCQPWDMRHKKNLPMVEKLHNMGFESLHDLLIKPPLRYVDRSEPVLIKDLIDGEQATVIATIVSIVQRSEKLWIMTVADDADDSMQCVFFNGSYLTKVYEPGDRIVISGVYSPYEMWNGVINPQMNQPSLSFADCDVMPIVPVYNQSGKFGVNSAMISNCIRELVDRLGNFKGSPWLEEAFKSAALTDSDGSTIEPDDKLSYGEALKLMHCPKSLADLQKASYSLAFSELVQMMLLVENSRKHEDKNMGIPIVSDSADKNNSSLTDLYVNSLEYNLTKAQSRVLKTINEKMSSQTPMRALLVGDVGSGKTTVIHLAALKAVEAGFQAAIVAPTEILATQLYDVFIDVMSKMPDCEAKSMIHPALYTSYKGKGAAAKKRETVQNIKDGSVNIIFGTHLVFSPSVKWNNLGFVGIDEQHKFGVEQRAALLSAREDGKIPHMLTQTATPIPRSIAQAFYGDVTYLHLNELPSGRLPITTQWIEKKGNELLEDRRNEIWDDVIEEANKGHGTFVICPMVEESEKLAAASVKKTFGRIQNVLGVQVQAGLVYGSQDKEEQAETIKKFRTGEIQVLVASSVVEVGVSCEKASRMIILDANRFGMASLHQIRGRIGRGKDLPSICYLVSLASTNSARTRMEAMVNSLDGWELAKKDLRARGAGKLFGDAQSGCSDFKFADLVENGAWLNEARRIARNVLNSNVREEALNDAKAWFEISD